jgi:hypothetical protein
VTYLDRLQDAAALAERAAIAGQYAEVTGQRTDPAVIGGLHRVADALYIFRPLDRPLGFRRNLVEATLPIGGWVLFCVAVLLAVPNPVQPVVLAATITGGAIVAGFLTVLVAAVWDRYSARALAAGGVAETVEQRIATIRSRLALIAATLETDHYDIRQRIDYSLYWLDIAEQAATRPPS